MSSEKEDQRSVQAWPVNYESVSVVILYISTLEFSNICAVLMCHINIPLGIICTLYKITFNLDIATSNSIQRRKLTIFLDRCFERLLLLLQKNLECVDS